MDCSANGQVFCLKDKQLTLGVNDSHVTRHVSMIRPWKLNELPWHVLDTQGMDRGRWKGGWMVDDPSDLVICW